MVAMQSFPEGGQQMTRFPAAVMGGPEVAKKVLPHTGTVTKASSLGQDPDPGTALCFP